jgi:hypothetical protein
VESDVEAEVSAEAREAADRAGTCIDERRFVDAIPDAERAAELAPAWLRPWWLLTIAYKHDLRWRDCLNACQRALTGDDDEDEGIHWNAGIAATALGDWEAARHAWRACGIAIPDGDGPLEMKLGLTPVRIDPKGNTEVVWCRRIDPCRAEIVSIPLPDSGRRHGDIVIHDGEPRGTRMLGEHERSVFDELTLLEASTMGTWVIEVDVDDEATLEKLFAPLEGTQYEDWTSNVRSLCAACSLGKPHDHHDTDGGPPAWQRRRRIGVAAPSEESFAPLRGFLGRWRRGVVSVKREL